MPRFQFSLGRLLACISTLCLAAAAWAYGFAALREANFVPFFIGWMVAWLMLGAGIGFLVANRVVVAFLGATAAFLLLVVLGFLLRVLLAH